MTETLLKHLFVPRFTIFKTDSIAHFFRSFLGTQIRLTDGSVVLISANAGFFGLFVFAFGSS